MILSTEYSKLAVHLWTNDLAKRLTAVKSGIILLIVHPGAIISVCCFMSIISSRVPQRTVFPLQDGAIRSLNTLTFPRFWIFIMGLMMHPQTMGAYTSVFAACSPKDNPHVFHGAYICPPNVSVPQGPNALNELKQRELAEFTEKILREIGI